MSVTVSPFSSSPSRSRNGTPSPFDPTPGTMTTGDSNLSLAVNYIPSKFSHPHLASLVHPSYSSSASGPRKRRRGGKHSQDDDDDDLGPGVPKMGGGVDAFRSGESRIGGPAVEDEDEEGEGEVDESGGSSKRGWFATRGKTRKARWNGFKWVLFCANLLLTIYSFTALIFCLLTWFNVWTHADIIRVGNHAELALSTLAACAGILTCLIGWVGILMNNRSFLAIYTFLLWIVFIFILIPGYLTYRRRTFNLEGKINAQWSKALGEAGRLRIQNQLQCCGYFSPYVEATISQTCYARTTLPGCKSRYLIFERRVLMVWYTVAFVLVPAHVGVMVAGLLCSNHVTYRFGKGMMPKAYRLSVASMAVIMDNYATQLAEQYGQEVATDVLNRSRSNLNLHLLSTVPVVPYADANANANVNAPTHAHTTSAPFAHTVPYTNANTNTNANTTSASAPHAHAHAPSAPHAPVIPSLITESPSFSNLSHSAQAGSVVSLIGGDKYDPTDVKPESGGSSRVRRQEQEQEQEHGHGHGHHHPPSHLSRSAGYGYGYRNGNGNGNGESAPLI
ncbi:hypothetical protein CPB84DRAFT_1688832 [Gymnopilus junonius]|uniref:Tetraspanin Tsp2 family n=1 Tax=Gymnopilus junonius TaxID=109634 RepID=A0A9P5TG99_GYMJU|nr:hypothetical protein CPB84DRAFT_1688832 [Gymnopilus junonius]